MRYRNFATNITLKYRMDIRGYPPSIKFCSPSQLSSLTEVELVLASWESGTTYWHRLDNEEFDQWRRTYARWRKRYTEAVAAGRVSDDGEEESSGSLTVLPGTSVSMSMFIVPGDDTLVVPQPTATPPGLVNTASTHGDVSYGRGDVTPMPRDVTPGSRDVTPGSCDVMLVDAELARNSAVAQAPDNSMPVPGDTLRVTRMFSTSPTPTAARDDHSIPEHPAISNLEGPLAAPTAAPLSPGGKRSSTSLPERGGKRAKASKDPFINLGCVTDANGRPKPIECSARKPRKKEMQPRKKKGTAHTGATATPGGDPVVVDGPVVSVWSLKTGKLR